MNALLLPEIFLGTSPADQTELALAAEGVQRYVWNGTFGQMLIEVRDGASFVNGQRVVLVDEMRSDASATGAQLANVNQAER